MWLLATNENSKSPEEFNKYHPKAIKGKQPLAYLYLPPFGLASPLEATVNFD
jgi:hypothetical protein